MDNMGKKLTDRELIAVLLGWYELDKSTDELRSAVAAYVREEPIPESLTAPVTSAVSTSSTTALSVATAIAPPPTPSFELINSHINGSTQVIPAAMSETIPVQRAETRRIESPEAKYVPQFEHTDEMIGSRGWIIDAWALYYGVEECFHRISFGLLNMHMLAFLFCILISGAVMVGVWQSNLSAERQKKATYKSMPIEPAEKTLRTFSPPESSSVTEAIANAESPDSEAAEVEAAAVEGSQVEARERPAKAAPNTSVAKTVVPAASVEPVAIKTPGSEFAPAIELIDKGSLDEALTSLQSLESLRSTSLQPLVTLLKIDVLIRKNDAKSMELSRQLLMDCKFGEFDVVYDLLVARWMLLSSADHRKRFLKEAESLNDNNQRRMIKWAQIRNGDTDALTEYMVKLNAAKGQSQVCDQLFLATYYYTIGNYAETTRELNEAKQKLHNLQSSRRNDAEKWLFESAKQELTSKVDFILNSLSRQPKEIN